MSTLTAADIKTLEQTRQRLSQLTSSLATLQNQILNSDPLPPWTSLQSQTQILSHSLLTLSSITSSSPSLQKIIAYPLPSYPGRTQEGLLNQLLRKKLEPGVEDWVDSGLQEGEKVAGDSDDGGKEPNGMKVQDWRELWGWAGVEANELARGFEWFGDGEEEDNEEEHEGEGEPVEKMAGTIKEDSGGMMPVEHVLRFMNRGEYGRA